MPRLNPNAQQGMSIKIHDNVDREVASWLPVARFEYTFDYDYIIFEGTRFPGRTNQTLVTEIICPGLHDWTRSMIQSRIAYKIKLVDRSRTFSFFRCFVTSISIEVDNTPERIVEISWLFESLATGSIACPHQTLENIPWKKCGF